MDSPRPGSDQEERLPDSVTISVERKIRFGHLVDLAAEYSSPDPVPEDPPLHLTRFGTLLTLSVSFMYSLFETRADSINLLRIWSGFDNPFREDLRRFDASLDPYRANLKLVRDRFDFHGSISREREGEGFDAYEPEEAKDLFRIVADFRDLCARMIDWFEQLPATEVEAPFAG